MFKRRYAVVAGLVVAGTAVIAWYRLRSPERIYSFTVDELFKAGRARPGASLRVEGTLAPGSLVHRDAPCQYRFKLVGAEREVPVVYDQCFVPDTLCDRPGKRARTVVEGSLDDTGTVHAAHIFVFCGGKAEFRALPDGGLVAVRNDACTCADAP